MKNILQGVKVLDLTRVLAGPWCTQTLADMGAIVYKIERPESGDELRSLPPFLSPIDDSAPPMSTSYAALNGGKHSLTVDISHAKGQAIIQALARKCDVLVENYKAGDLVRYGLDEKAIRKINPNIIYCSITGFGHSGPLASRAGYDPVFQAITGIMSTCGVPDGMPGEGPQRSTMPVIDVMAGMTATSAVLGALLHRKNGGSGQFLDITLLDVALAATMPYSQTYLSTGKIPGRQGNTSQLVAPADCYRCAGGRYILIYVANDVQWRRMYSAMNLGDWFREERFATSAGRVIHATELNAKLCDIFLVWDLHALEDILGNAGVPCGAVNTLAEAFDQPQVKHRGIQMETDHPLYGRIPYVRNPINYSDTPLVRGLLPLLGGNTASVLSEELGMTQEEFEHLRQERVT